MCKLIAREYYTNKTYNCVKMCGHYLFLFYDRILVCVSVCESRTYCTAVRLSYDIGYLLQQQYDRLSIASPASYMILHCTAVLQYSSRVGV